ncbi:biotin/lipoyl-containing protein [Modestobacter sp. NPDC049651]|uniref:acetyl-CoA carboxylase biotin carboxyl carrier protein n=1 Tax=unclassified Modestobacter TaxID=2643866 RepID=UPI0033DD7601
MTPNELVQRPPAGTSPTAPVPDLRSRRLHEEVLELARALPGDLRRLTVRSGDTAIEIEWAPAGLPGGGDGGDAAPVRQASAAAVPADRHDGLTAVTAPLVGTFYAAPSPDADPFVRVGDEVEAGRTIGIVEAMKLMNPVVAEQAGVVTEVVAGNAESVEYGQVLLYLRPTGQP